MRYKLFLFFVLPSALLGAQEKLALNSNIAAQKGDISVVGGTGSVLSPPMVIDGPPPLPPPMTLKIQSFAVSSYPAGDAAIGRKELKYELRLTNVTSKPIDIPASPALDKMYRSCKSGQEQKVGLTLEFEKKQFPKISLSGNRIWAGCRSMKDSLVMLLPGEWITYHGSASLPPNADPPGSLTATWLISDISYSSTPDGLIENSKTSLVISSTGQQVE